MEYRQESLPVFYACLVAEFRVQRPTHRPCAGIIVSRSLHSATPELYKKAKYKEKKSKLESIEYRVVVIILVGWKSLVTRDFLEVCIVVMCD